MSHRPLGLYIHIPFCARICHYCDFAKSANFSHEHVKMYLDVVTQQLRQVIRLLPADQLFSSVYFGGGTPGLFTDEYTELLKLIQEVTMPGAEITLEANPLNVSTTNASAWRRLGFNRLSLGIQSFNEDGLKALTREHSRKEALSAMAIACGEFPFVNGDLIYGWVGQTHDLWRDDLEQMANTGCGHISAYALTYEGQTPFARAERRGVITPCSDEDLSARYMTAKSVLGARGYGQEEVSNWAKHGHEARHNWLYWSGDHYVGLGCGAHGYVDDGSTIGLRYSFAGDFRKYLRGACPRDYVERDIESFLIAAGADLDRDRGEESWMLEYVSSSLRCRDGVEIDLLRQRGFDWVPSALVRDGMRHGLLVLDDLGILRLREDEWFRETSWSTAVCDSLIKKTGAR